MKREGAGDSAGLEDAKEGAHMSGKKARETRREDNTGLLVNIFGVIEWNAGGSGTCNVCKKHIEACAKVTVYDSYSMDPDVLMPLRGTLAGELQVDEHMRRVMKAQAAGRFIVSAKKLYCWEHAKDLVAGWLTNDGLALYSAILPMITGKDMFTAMVMYSEPGAWGYSTPAAPTGYGRPDLSKIFRIARENPPKRENRGNGGLTMIDVHDD